MNAAKKIDITENDAAMLRRGNWARDGGDWKHPLLECRWPSGDALRLERERCSGNYDALRLFGEVE